MSAHFVRRSSARGVSLLAAIGLASVSSIVNGQVSDFAMFGGAGLSLGQSTLIRGGATGSNGSIAYGSFNEYHGFYAGGAASVLSLGGSSTFAGPVVVNGNATIGQYSTVSGPLDVGGTLTTNSGVVVNGNVTAGGAISTSFGTVTGTVRTNGDYSQTSSFDVQNGNVFANGAASIKGSVVGNLTYGTTYTVGPFGSVSGAVTHAASVATPISFAPRTLPPATTFTSGGAPVVSSGDVHLAPGSYGALSMGTLNDLYLTGGNYSFDSFNFDGFNIHLDNVTAATPLNVYVAGNITADSLIKMTINGLPFAAVASDPSYANLVKWETHGNFTEASLGANEWIGTIFAPAGDVTFGQFTDVAGAVYASGTITTGPGFQLNVPEPTTLTLLAFALPLTRRRRPG